MTLYAKKKKTNAMKLIQSVTNAVATKNAVNHVRSATGPSLLFLIDLEKKADHLSIMFR